MEVAKTEFLYVFGIDSNVHRSESALSDHTVRPTQSFASLPSISEVNASPSRATYDNNSVFSPPEVDVSDTIQHLISNLRGTSPSVSHTPTNEHIEILENRIDEANAQCTSITLHFRARIEEASKVVRDLRRTAERIESIRHGVTVTSTDKLRQCGLTPISSRRRNRDSEDSQATFVDDDVSVEPPIALRVPASSDGAYVSTGTQTSFLDLFISDSATARPVSLFLDQISVPSSPTSSAQMSGLWEIERQLKELGRESSPTSTPPDSPKKDMLKLKQVMKKRKKLEDKLQDLESSYQLQKTSTSRLKAWFKRMVASQQPPPKLRIVHDLGGVCNVGHEVKTPEDEVASPPATDLFIDSALRSSKVVLEAAQRDLVCIFDCLDSAERFIDAANHSISRTHRVVKRAVKVYLLNPSFRPARSFG